MSALLYTDAPLYAALGGLCAWVTAYWAADRIRWLARRRRP